MARISFASIALLAVTACGEQTYLVVRCSGPVELPVDATSVTLFEAGVPQALAIDELPSRLGGTLPTTIVLELDRELAQPLVVQVVGYDASDAPVALGTTRFTYASGERNRVDVVLSGPSPVE